MTTWNCIVLAGKTPKVYASPSVYSPSFGYLASGQEFTALRVRTDVVDPNRPGAQVWLEMEDGRWTFAQYPRTNGEPDYFVSYEANQEPPSSDTVPFTLTVNGFKSFEGMLERE